MPKIPSKQYAVCSSHGKHAIPPLISHTLSTTCGKLPILNSFLNGPKTHSHSVPLKEAIPQPRALCLTVYLPYTIVKPCQRPIWPQFLPQ